MIRYFFHWILRLAFSFPGRETESFQKTAKPILAFQKLQCRVKTNYFMCNCPQIIMRVSASSNNFLLAPSQQYAEKNILMFRRKCRTRAEPWHRPLVHFKYFFCTYLALNLCNSSSLSWSWAINFSISIFNL